jgi:hypothetical protein
LLAGLSVQIGPSDLFQETLILNSDTLVPTLFPFVLSEPFAETHLEETASFVVAATSAADQSDTGRSSSTGVIVGVTISVLCIVAAVVIGLIFLKKRSQIPELTEETSSDPEIQFVPDIGTTTADETPVSFHESFTYEGAAVPITTVDASTVAGNDRSTLAVPLL